jgi:hypothetical protein
MWRKEDRRDGWVGLSAARKITTEPWDGILAKFQQQTDALFGVLGEVWFNRMLRINRCCDRRSWAILAPYFLRKNGQRAEKSKRQQPSKKKNLLTAPTLLEMAGFQVTLIGRI